MLLDGLPGHSDIDERLIHEAIDAYQDGFQSAGPQQEPHDYDAAVYEGVAAVVEFMVRRAAA